MKRLAATLLLASRVRPAFAFARRQLRATPGVHEYEIRATGQRALIRHHTDDPHVLAECFGRLDQYRPPREVSERLAAEPPRRVVDLGGNIGLFGLLALDCLPDAELTSFEPDPDNAALLERVIELNGLTGKWRLERAAAAPAPATLSFAAGRSSRSHAVEGAAGGETIEVEAVDAFGELQRAELIKIDIEGGEWALLADSRLDSLPARVIVLEYHGAGSPSADARGAAVSALQRAGYRVETRHEHDRGEDPREGLGVAWAWRDG